MVGTRKLLMFVYIIIIIVCLVTVYTMTSFYMPRQNHATLPMSIPPHLLEIQHNNLLFHRLLEKHHHQPKKQLFDLLNEDTREIMNKNIEDVKYLKDMRAEQRRGESWNNHRPGTEEIELNRLEMYENQLLNESIMLHDELLHDIKIQITEYLHEMVEKKVITKEQLNSKLIEDFRKSAQVGLIAMRRNNASISEALKVANKKGV